MFLWTINIYFHNYGDVKIMKYLYLTFQIESDYFFELIFNKYVQ